MTYSSSTWHDVVDVNIVETEIADENAENLCNSCQDNIEEQCMIEDMQSMIKAMPQSKLHAILDVMWESEDEYKSDIPAEQPTTEEDNKCNTVYQIHREQTEPEDSYEQLKHEVLDLLKNHLEQKVSKNYVKTIMKNEILVDDVIDLKRRPLQSKDSLRQML